MELKPDSNATNQRLDEIAAGGASFDELFARYREMLRQAVELRLDNGLRARVDASDVVQETQLEAFRRLPDYLERRPMPFRLWLRKMASERLIMLRRQHVNAARRSVRREYHLPAESSVQLGRQLIGGGPTPSQEVRAEELADQVRQAVAGLPEQDRELLLMRNYEGLSYNEIGQILDIDPATARKRNGRALVKLHSLLRNHGVTESGWQT